MPKQVVLLFLTWKGMKLACFQPPITSRGPDAGSMSSFLFRKKSILLSSPIHFIT
uniref:Uncharacterized protein n=1 Tax=Setaria viridis TaxID=4556 RepID=A0A4U6VKV6_SETVI|nr:hypothetical protein SEVIR_3G322203v2 [Setaria viridis]